MLRPKWLVAHLGVALLSVGFVLLGFWQLDRHRQRVEENGEGLMRISQDPVPLTTLLEAQLEELEYRMVRVSGVFDADNETLVRSQVYLGSAGFHVITPLVGEGGAVLINRGWVPLGLDEVPVTAATPPPGEVEVLGWVQLSETRPLFGRVEPEGPLSIINRVDIARIREQLPYPVADVYLVEVRNPSQNELPVPAELSTFDDSGPHLAYAIQWFGFATVGLIGYFFILRRSWRQPGQSPVGERARSGTTS